MEEIAVLEFLKEHGFAIGALTFLGIGAIIYAREGMKGDSTHKSESYVKRSIADAVKCKKKSRIKGVVKSYARARRGYSGFIDDGTAKGVFYVEEHYLDRDDAVLVPLFLEDSKENQLELILDGKFCRNKIFHVNTMIYNQGSIDYKVG